MKDKLWLVEWFDIARSLVYRFWSLLMIEIEVEYSLGVAVLQVMPYLKSFKMKDHFTKDKTVYGLHPFSGFVFMANRLTYVEVPESNKDDDCPSLTIQCFRWDRSRIQQYLKTLEMEISSQDKTDIDVLTVGHSSSTKRWIGYVSPVQEPFLHKSQYAAAEADVALCALGQKKKVGIILYGPPGNGKTSLVKYFARKYKMDVLVFTPGKKIENADVQAIFGEMKTKKIFLMEDFDHMLDKDGKVDSKQYGYSVESLLSGLDGIYSNYNGVVFIMTANDISKIHDALKNRPGRFKHIIEIVDPDEDIRARVVGNDSYHLEATAGMSLDRVIDYADRNGLLAEE